MVEEQGLGGMTYASEWLVELEAHDGNDVVTLRFSVNGYTTGPGDTPANTVFESGIAGISSFARHLYGEGRTIGEASGDAGAFVLSNADGRFDALKGYAVDGRPFRLMRLASPFAAFSTAETVLTGTMTGIDTSEGSLTIRIPFYDRRRDLDVPLQEERYEGTTTSAGATAEGSADLKDRVKPLVFGRCYSVPAVVVNDFDMFLQFSASPVHSIALYDGGVPLINDGDEPDLTALRAATGNPGHYKTCLALGIAKPFGTFNGRPAFIWTADVVEGSTPAARRAGAIVERMLARIGQDGANIDAASFSALNSLATAEVGIYLDNETTVLSAVYDVLRSVGAYLMPDNFGRFTVGRIDQPGVPIKTLTDPEILTASPSDTLAFIPNPDTEGAVPANAVQIKYRRHWHVHSDSDLGHCANFGDPTRGNSLKQEWRETREESAAVKARHLLSRELEFETLLVEQADAQAESARRLSLYGVHRDVTRVALAFDDAKDLVPNITVNLVTDRFDYADGKPMLIIGREEDPAAERVVLTLWG